MYGNHETSPYQKSKRARMISGIVLIVSGVIIAISAMVLMISDFAGTLYKDISFMGLKNHYNSIPFDIDAISIKPGQDISLWLSCPDRSIENKDIGIRVFIINSNGTVINRLEENFRVGYTRNSAGKNHYYKLGNLSLPLRFKGVLKYQTIGSWKHYLDCKLVLRTKGTISIGWLKIIALLTGVIFIISGIGTIIKAGKIY